MPNANATPVPTIADLFSAEEVLHVDAGLSEDEIISTLVEKLYNRGDLTDKKSAFEAVVQRKCCSFLNLTPEIVVLHAKLASMRRLGMALALSPTGVQCHCNTTHTASIKLIVLILAPIDVPGGYMRVLSALRTTLNATGFFDELIQLDDSEAIWEAFRHAGVRLPEYVAAGDIMRTQFHALRDTDTLSSAIDAFCQTDNDELPVVDADSDLIGVVSEDELLRICLPEYITWMEDLSPILDFEPFAEVLRREIDMPIVEIMLFPERYATTDESAPAIQVAKIMIRRDVKRVMVTRGKKLVGVISIADFIRKVLRA